MESTPGSFIPCGRFEKTREKFKKLFGGEPTQNEGTDAEFMRILQRFIFGEVYGTRLSNKKAVKLIKAINPLNKLVTADSAEPRTINEFKLLGLNITGAKKGPDSVENGIKWLQDLETIIIDPVRCPNAAREFNDYEIEKDKEGNLKGDFPDKNNHTIDAARYGCEQDIIMSKGRASKNRSRYE